MAIPLLLANNTAADQEVTLVSHLPSEWVEVTRPTGFRVKAHDISAIEAFVTAPAKATGASVVLTWEASADGHPLGSVTIRIYPGYPYFPN